MKDESEPFGKLMPEWYEDQLLHLAHDLAARLIPAFENSSTGLPLPRVSDVYESNFFVGNAFRYEKILNLFLFSTNIV